MATSLSGLEYKPRQFMQHQSQAIQRLASTTDLYTNDWPPMCRQQTSCCVTLAQAPGNASSQAASFFVREGRTSFAVPYLLIPGRLSRNITLQQASVWLKPIAGSNGYSPHAVEYDWSKCATVEGATSEFAPYHPHLNGKFRSMLSCTTAI